MKREISRTAGQKGCVESYDECCGSLRRDITYLNYDGKA